DNDLRLRQGSPSSLQSYARRWVEEPQGTRFQHKLNHLARVERRIGLEPSGKQCSDIEKRTGLVRVDLYINMALLILVDRRRRETLDSEIPDHAGAESFVELNTSLDATRRVVSMPDGNRLRSDA